MCSAPRGPRRTTNLDWVNKRPRRLLLAAILLLAAVVWLPINSPVEGPVLLRISYNHGVHIADLLSVALAFAAALSLLTARRGAR